MIRAVATTDRPRPQFLDRTMLRFSASEQIIDGLLVGAFRQEAAAGVARVEQALALIRTFDPLRYHRLLRDLERIWIKPLPGGLAVFDQALWICKLDERFVLDAATSIEQIAAAIVHEATHARLARRGFSYTEPVRHRIEAICVRSELRFAKRLPNSDAISEQADRLLSLCEDAEYWTDAAFEARHEAEVKEVFRHLGYRTSWSGFSMRSTLGA
jgi:hypothetical protein